ncbi:MAG: CBS domain-containing protein [Solirubrobacteraceae bacterium]
MSPPAASAPTDVTEMHRTTVVDVMHPGILACAASARLVEVARIMSARRVHCVAVIGGSEAKGASAIAGVITDMDLLRWATGSETHLPAGAIVRRPIVTAAPDSPVHDAAELMVTAGADHVVVADDEGAPLGILSALDVAKVLSRGRV